MFGQMMVEPVVITRAIFLILGMYDIYGRLIQVSGAPSRATLAHHER